MINFYIQILNHDDSFILLCIKPPAFYFEISVS